MGLPCVKVVVWMTLMVVFGGDLQPMGRLTRIRAS
jgi:hypothetical protein